MATDETTQPINALHQSVVGILDPEFKKAYEYQVGKVRADQVFYEVYNADRPQYSFPTAKVTGLPVNGPDGEINVEVYVPTADAAARGGLEKDRKPPAVINFHGGGFVIGGLKADESWCRQVCQAVGCIMINVEYRLSPEYPHPTPVMDGYQALQWVVKNAAMLKVDTSRIAVSGLSGGGRIAAVCAAGARRPVYAEACVAILIVPVIDGRYMPEEDSAKLSEDLPYESYISCEHAPMLPLVRLIWFYNLWLGRGEIRQERANDFRASPIAAAHHGGLASAALHVAEVDPLRSEAEAYHAKLLEDGTSSSIRIYKGMGHTFAHWDEAVSAGYQFFLNSAQELQDAFAL
ncbi:alpha beta hydrolase fold-3 domain-containing protein [Thozetella sp. PMI_491]|nr:alpha beta hydrolase fold-3 domain-containing protein [Thozetella sp. PMI_491]